MKINQITYYDHELEWQLETINLSELTLLVGVSGVGKTRILKSIMNLKKIANGSSFNGVEWDITFSINNDNYQWSGKFETIDTPYFLQIPEDKELEEQGFRINQEYLSRNNKQIIERSDNQISFNGVKLPKLSPFKSAVEILSEEEDIAPIKNGLNRIIYSEQLITSDGTIGMNGIYPFIYRSLSKYNDKNFSDKGIQESNLPTPIKLALIYKYCPEKFDIIKEHFLDAFIQVEDIKLEPVKIKFNPIKEEELNGIIAEYPIVHIKEKGVNDWISQEKISSGMFKTLMHISEMYLSAEGTVILIDEFENSLGVNCIDVVSDLLLENRKLQFIITSHHPYIINKIGMEHWKIVTRKGGVVTVRDAKDFNLGKSRHQAFIQLINLDAYREGIAVE